MASRSGYLLKHSVKQVEYGKLVDLLFHSHSSTTSNTAGNDIDTPHSFGDTPCGKRTSHRRAEAAKLITECTCVSGLVLVRAGR
ncbi:hypothetical protein WJX82_005434 [Trebouxia sp. C0006]